MKICIAVLSRANFGRLKSVIREVKKKHELQLIYGCSFYNTQNEFEPDFRIQALLSGDDTEAMVLTTGLFLTKLTDALKTLKPDMVLVHGDRYEVLACAIACAYMNIPLAHTEGGEQTGTIDDKVRYAISSLADIHFPVTEKAARRLKRLVKKPENVFVVGSTALDSLKEINLSSERTEPYIVVLFHPNTTDPEPIEPLIEALSNINIKKIWVNPNVDAGNKAMLKLIHKQDVEFVKDLPPEEYVKLIKNSLCLVGNTSSGIKEGAYLGVPYVCIGKRQNKREHDKNTLFVGNNAKAIQLGIMKQTRKTYEPSYKFGDGTAAEKIVEVLSTWIPKQNIYSE
jgi:UDP-hydrolysing UDP-N-acetyl-D-glucosamine 2-epimerase